MNTEYIKQYNKFKLKKALLLSEGLLTGLIFSLLTPSFKRDLKKYKKTPEWDELHQRAKIARDEMNALQARMESQLDDCLKQQKEAKKAGLPVFPCFDNDPNATIKTNFTY